MSKYIAYPKAMKLLIDNLGATSEELAGWIWQGSEEGGLSAYLNVIKLKNPPKFYYDSHMGQDYLSPLMSCWFLRDDIVNFKPVDRYITGKSLIERWSEQSGIKAKAFILAKIAESRLTDYHPTLGGTRGSNTEDMSFPPLESGLFLLSETEAIERDDFGLEKNNKDEDNGDLRIEPEIGSAEWRRENARNAAHARHSQPGGSNDKRNKVIEMWKSGNFSSKSNCARKASEIIGISFSTARKALYNL